MDNISELVIRDLDAVAPSQTIDGMIVEALATKPAHFTTRMALAVLTLERHDRGILNAAEAAGVFKVLLDNGDSMFDDPAVMQARRRVW